MSLRDRFPVGREVVCVKTFEIGEDIVFRGEVGLVNKSVRHNKQLEINMPRDILILSNSVLDNWELVP
jgi:hypothetical protein